MLIKFKSITFVLLLGLIMPVFSSADDDFNPSSYLFFLYYDRGQLFTNRDFATSYDVTTKEYKEKEAGENVFRGEIFSHKNNLLATFQFDPKNGQTNFQKGAITVPAPYFYNAKDVYFYNNLGDRVLVISVAVQSFCNENGVCDGSENTEICPVDCATFIPSPSASKLSDQDTLVNWGAWSLGYWIGGLVLVVTVAIWLALRKLRKKKNDLPPPQI